MSYHNDHPVRLIGGRLALDFVNTADWSADGEVVHEKIASLDDVIVWAAALGLENAVLPSGIEPLLALRSELQSVFTCRGSSAWLNSVPSFREAKDSEPVSAARRQSLETLIAASAISIIADEREITRLKMCPGENCGWLFIDETKNARRKWCSMETCGNRAKAARHYLKARTEAV